MSESDESRPGNPGDTALIRSNVTININDVLGFGRAAKSDAAKEVVRAIGGIIGALARPLEIYLAGRAKNSVKADALTSKTQAEVDTAIIGRSSQTGQS
jgi:hypothetical protein